ncbi:cystatin-C-like [Lontra canadensis]|uniref:cystatin-C-like n=1 Tax=Lontra canadensis TaxID=76717 RepID=UPI0013F2E078|nr:cystatin-C-like [Lontra canadensis]
MAGHLRTPLLLLAALALTQALAVALGPGASRKNGKSPMVGGLLDADVNEEGVQQALNFALSEYNKESNDAYHSRAMRVVRVRKQVVAGMNYFLEVEIGRTRCTKSQPNLDSCPFHDQPHLMMKTLCSFQIHTVPWLGKTSLVKSSCQKA